VSGERVRVLRIIARLNVGGPALHAAALCNLDPVRFQTMIAYGSLGPDEADMSDLLRGTAAEVTFIPELGRALNPFRDVVAFAKLLLLMFRFRPHVIHTHTAKAGSLGRTAGEVFRWLSWRHRCHMVHTFHGHVFEGYFSPAKSRAAVFAERRLAALSDCILTLSEGLRTDLVERFQIAPRAKVRIVPLGLDLEPFLDSSGGALIRRELGIAQDACVVTCVGRLVPVKNHSILLRVAALMAQRGANSVVLLIVGGGDLLGSLRREVEGLGIAASVRFLGWRRDLPALYAASDVVVLTSLNEGTPVSLIEAMAAGLPVVATAVGGVPDVVEDGLTGTLVPSGSVEALAHAIEALVANRDLRASFGRAGRERAFQRYTREGLITQIAALYEELLLTGRRTTHALAG
jgi:glycosyltransferase involved in cell wall biosynthesis